MEEFEASNGKAEILAKEFAKEKNDIVCGFVKEKEIIEMMHREEMNDLIAKFEEDKEYMRNEFEFEKEDLLQGFQTQQVEKINEFQRERENMEAKQAKDRRLIERTLEMKYKEEKVKMRQEYEDVIAEKNEEIKMLRRELLRVQHDGDGLTRSSPDNDIYIKRIEHEDELRRASDNFEIEKLELERKSDREKAELVQVFTNQAERMNANYDEEKNRIQLDHQKELEFKLEVTERLHSEKSDLERKRMIQQFEREITELQESLEIGFKETLLEKQEAIDDLEKDKKELLNALQTERFSLAQVYNREVSLLTNPDQLTKEDVEVALIDEIAKLKQEHDDTLNEMEGQHKQKIEVIKRGQQPVKELEQKHRKETETLKKKFENEKERMEAEFRKEQFNLLKSFEFERNDLEQRYEEIINEKELEIQQREDDMRRVYEGELDELKSIVEKQREELEISKQKLGDLAGEMEEFLSEKNRIEERCHKENNQCQTLEQKIDKNLRAFEKNTKEAEGLHQKEISQREEEFERQKSQLKEQLENEKLELQSEIETLKARLDELQMASENVIVASNENIVERDLAENNAVDEERSYTAGVEESKPVGNKSPLEEIEEEEGPLEEKEGQEGPLENTEGEEKEEAQRNVKVEVNECLQKIRERLKKCIPDEEKNETLGDLQMSNKHMKDAINQAIVEIDKLSGNKDEYEDVSLGDQPTFSLEDQLLALEGIFKEGDADGKSEKSSKDQLNEKVKEILNNAQKFHELEKLKLKEEHQEEINKVLKELADEKRGRVQEALEALKKLQELDESGDRSLNDITLKATEEKGTITVDLDHTKNDGRSKSTGRDSKENDVRTDFVDELKREKEEMKRTIDELEKSFTKEKEELTEKLQTQHKEFVMSEEGEIIENLLKQKSTLEEAFNLERFYLSRLYYLEMKDELEDILCRKKEKMKRDFDRDKMDIILKYESDIADLHSLLSEKGEMELRLLQDRNEAMRKLLATQKRSTPEKGRTEERRKDTKRLEREKENLEVTIPLKKEIAELQNRRHQEHETAVANLKEAIDLIKDIMSNPPSIPQGEDQQLDRYSFVSEDPVRSDVATPVDKSSEGDLKPGKRLLLSEDEIRNKDELKVALENLVELVLNEDEDSVYESEATSGASSDLESEESGPTTVNGESDEGAFSGPESTDGDTLNIKKADLDFAFNLERFNLGRVYYGEYRDSLKKAMKKLAKAKDSLRNKRKDLENEMLSGIKKLVDRAQFGEENMQVAKQDIDTQTADIKEAGITDHEDRTEDKTDGKQLTEIQKEPDKTESMGGDDGAMEDPQGDIERAREEKKKGNFQDADNTPEETLVKSDESLTGKEVTEEKPQEKITLGDKNNQDDPHSEHDIENATIASKMEAKTDTETEQVLSEDKDDRPGKTDKDSGELEDKTDDEGTKEQKSPKITEYNDSEAEITPFEKQRAEESIMAEAEDVDDIDGRNSDAEIKSKDDASIEKPLDEENKKPTTDKEEASRGNEDQEEDGDIKEDILAEEAEINANDASLGKLLSQNNETPKEVREEASQGSKDQDKDGDEVQTDKEEMLTEAGQVDDGSYEKPPHQNIETPTEDRREASQKRKDADKIDGDEEEADKGDILTEAEDDDDIDKLKGDDRISHDDRNSKDVTEGEAGRDKKGLDRDNTEYEVKQKEEKPVIHKEDEAHKPLDDHDEVATETRETEKINQKDEKPKDYAECEVEPEFESKLSDANELKMNIKPSHESPRNEQDENGDENLAVSEDIQEYDRLSDKSDGQFQTAEEEDEELSFQRSTSPVNDRDLIKQLNRNNKILQDKFNLLRELVGKGFVNEIPELSDEKGKEDNLVALESLNDLYAEKEQLNDELKQVDSQLKELAATGNDKLEDLNKRLDDEELNLLHSLGEIDKHLKKNDNKELMEHLLKEKEDVCTKLDEINNLLNEQKEAMAELGSKDVHTVPGLMCKKDVLKDDLSEKERQLSYKSKMLEAAKKASGKEKENLETSLNSLTAQLAALEDGMRDSDDDAFPYRPKESNKELPSEIVSLVKSKADIENESEKLEKEIKKTENDIGRYGRILEEQRDRLQPFQRKRARIEESLDWASKADEITSKASEEDIEDGVEDPVYDKSENDALLTDKTDLVDDVEAISERHLEIEKKIEELDFAISNLELPYVLEQELTKDIPTAEKVGIVHQVMDRAEEDLECLEANIVVEQSALREAGFSDPIRLTQHLQEKEKLKKDIDKLDNYQSAMTGSKDEVDHPEVKQLESLLLQKESLEEKAHKLDGEISDEQRNFLEARQFKSTGKVNAESESNIKELIDTKDTSGKDLQETNEKILQTLSTGGLKGPQAEFIEECVERKVRLEDEIYKLQDKIDDETVRAAEMLVGLLEEKTTVNEELKNVTKSATEEVKSLQENLLRNDGYDNNIPEEISELISQARLILEPEATATVTQERKELHQKQKEREETVKEKAESVAEAKRREQDPDEVEDALEQVIREKISVDEKLQKIIEYENDGRGRTLPLTFRKHEERLTEARNPEQDPGQDDDNLDHDHVIGEKPIQTLQDENDGSETTIPALQAPHAEGEADTVSENRHSDENLDEKRRELEDNLREIENRLYNLLPSSERSDGLETGGLENIKSLAAEKVKLEEDIQQAKLLEDLLNEKEALLQEKSCGKDANKDGRERKTQLGGELKKLNELTERRENELQKIETKMDDKKNKLQQLNDDKEKLDQKLEPLKEDIEKAKKEVEASLVDAHTNRNEHEECSTEEEQALQQELEALQDDIELCNKEAKEVGKELNRLKKESHQRKDAIPGDVLDLEKLLIEKENLREYLAEIDATLDNSETDATEQETPANIEELRKQKKEVEIKLEEIRNEKAKLDVQFEDDEMDEAMKDLAQRKKELEERQQEVSDQICGSGVVGKLAEKRKKHDSKMPRYYIQGILDEMTRDEKTLTELIKEQEDIKAASQRQRERLEDMIDSVKSKVGEDLVNALTSLGPEDIQPDKGKEYRAGIDEVKGNEATISDILNDLSAENKELRDMNGELSSDLEMLKAKIGEELVEALLSQSVPIKELEFGEVISAVQDEEETLSNILWEQKEQRELIDNMLGKDLLNSILRKEDTLDTRHDADSTLELMAPAIMRKYDEDLENVIAVYEKELDNLSRENDSLKETLGKDLSLALLQMSKRPETPVGIDNIKQEIPPRTQDGNKGLDETKFEGRKPSTAVRNDGKSPPLKAIEGRTLASQESSDSDITPTEDTDTGNDTEKKTKESMKGSDVPKLETRGRKETEKERDIHPQEQQMEDIDHFKDTETLPEQGEISSIKQNIIAPRLYKIVASHFGSPAEKSSSDLTDEEDGMVKGSLNAPTIMRENGNTLEEVIAQYESNLIKPINETGKQRAAMDSSMTTDRFKIEKPDGISKVDETMQGIIDSQEKNMEMLRILKERLGDDLVYALIHETEEDHLDDLMGDEVMKNDLDEDLKQTETGGLVESQQDYERKFHDRSFTEPGKESPEEHAFTEVGEAITESNSDALPREVPTTSMEYKEQDSVQTNIPEEDTTNRRTLKAPSIALQNKKTLADVIASYEDGLDSLRTKLGPQLTNTLLSMEDLTIAERENNSDQDARNVPVEELKEEAPDGERQEKAEEEESDKEQDQELTKAPDKTPVVGNERESLQIKELRAPDIMATSGKTLEEVIEDYEERINEELNNLEEEVCLLKEKIGNDLFLTLLGHPNTAGENSSAEELTDQVYTGTTNPESFTGDDLKAKSLLQDEGKTVENILRKYEKQLEELSKLLPSENNEGVSILDLTSNYEDKIADLENENKTFSDRLANLSEIVGPDLLNKLENMEEEQNNETEDDVDGVEEDWIKAPMTMKKEDKSLEKVVRNYEKELDVLRKIAPNQDDENTSITDIIKEYEDKIDDLENRNKGLQKEHGRLVSRIGSDLVDDILTLPLVGDESVGDKIHQSDGDLSEPSETFKFNDTGRLNAPVIMNKDDSTLEDVLQIYEKALGLLPRPPIPRDDSFVDRKMHTFDDFKRENKILKDALGDSLATDLIAIAEKATPPISGNIKPMSYLPDESKQSQVGELKSQSEEKTKSVGNPAENAKQSGEQDRDDDMPVSPDVTKLDALELVRDEERTIENILKNYEKELEALRKLVPSETSEGTSVSELVKDYEDRIEKLENEKKNSLDMLNNLEKNIGPRLMEELQNFNTNNKEHGNKNLDDKKFSDLEAPILMENENRTLEGVVKNYENELNVLRKLVPDQGEETSSISDIIKDYEDKLEGVADENKTLKDELRELQEKMGHSLFNDIQKLKVSKAEATESVNEAGENGDKITMKMESSLTAPDLMNVTKLPLEDIVAIYEQDLYNLERENKVYKDGLGKGLAEALLQMAHDKNSYSCGEFETQESDAKELDNGELEAISKSNEGMPDKPTEQKQDTMATIRETYSKYKKRPSQNDVEDETKEDPGTGPDELKATNRPRDERKDLENSVADPAENAKQSSKQDRGDGMPGSPDVNKLDALELMRDEERAMENILKNYEKELEALRKLVPSETGEAVSVSELVKDYEDRIEKLENEKNTSLDMLNNLEKNIGPDLMEELKYLNNNNKEHGNKHLDEKKPSDLEAPILMENENRTLEGVVKMYENELDILRKLVPDQGEATSSISDIIKDYEDKLEGVADENKTLKDELGELQEKIGHGLFNDIQQLQRKAEATESVSEAGENGDKSAMEMESTLKAPDIMNETNLPLEDIVATYEQDLYNLERENKVYKDGLGNGQAEALLQMAQARDNYSSGEFETQESDTKGVDNGDLEAISKSNEGLPGKPTGQNIDTIAIIRGTYSKYKRQPSQNDVDDEAKADVGTGPDELKAMSLLRDEGQDLEKILKTYEKELEALRKLTPDETEDGMSISDLIKDYENKIEKLESENRIFTQKLDNLVETIGQDLYGALDNLQPEETEDDAKDYSSDKEIDINAVNVMKNEDRSLENVVKNYEKELNALRKLVPGGEGDSGSISDVIKEYEDKVEELQRRNQDLKNTLDQLEEKIGSNLFNDLCTERDEVGSVSDNVASKGKIKRPETPEKSTGPEIKNEKEQTLESIMASYENDIDDLTKENKLLKEGLGQRLAQTLLNMAEEQMMSPITDSDDDSHAANMQVSEEPMTSPLSRKRIARVTGDKQQRTDTGSMEDVSSQPLDKNNNDETEVSTASAPGELKAESLIRDEGRTIETILKNYEKELEALTKLVPSNDGISISDLVTKYEDTIESLKKGNDHLVNRLDNIEQRIGPELLSEVENREPEADPRLKDDKNHGEEGRLMAPEIMQKEKRTLENVVKTYEKELDALRSLVPSEGGDGRSINDVVKTYEDKVDQLRSENESLINDSKRLAKRIGPNLVQDIETLEEISSDANEGTSQSGIESELETEKPVKDLKVTKIMDVKKSTLEDVLETYENALGVLLSDSSSSIDDLNSGNFIDDHTSNIEELKRENDILKNSVGVSLSQRLLNMAKDDESDTEQSSRDSEETAEIAYGERDPDFNENESAKVLKHPSQKVSQEDALSNKMAQPGELKAESLIKEGGKSIENILKNYEKELEALKSLVSNESGQPVDTISDLVTKYEDEIDTLKKEKSNLADRIEFLEGKIGADLMNDLENQKHLHQGDSKDTLEDVRKSELKAPVIIEEEGRTLETVINCYEKELDALRKLSPNQEEGQQVSISDIIKEYEDKLDDLKDENNTRKIRFDALTDRLGSNLVNDINRLNEEEVERDESSEVEKETKLEAEDPGTKNQLIAPKIMRENNSTLENVLETYEDALGLDNTGFSSEDVDKANVTGDQLKTFKEIQEENKILKDTLGEKLAQSILEMAKASKPEEDLDHDDSIHGTDGAHQNVLTELAQKRRSSLHSVGQDGRPFDFDLTAPSDDLKAKALLREKGNTVENILKNYEKEIEALSKLIPNETDSEKARRNSDEQMELLKERVGFDLVNELLLLKETDSETKQRWEAVDKMKEEEKTLADILETYERELERLKREKSAIEVLVNDNESDGQSALDIISQYEDEIEHLRDKNKELETKLSVLFARMGDHLVNDVLDMKSNQARTPRSSLKALEIMEKQEKQLSAIIEQYENEISRLSRENETLKAIASKERVDGKPLTSLVSEYEMKIQDLLDEKHQTEANLKVLSEKVGSSLAQELLRPGETGESFSLDAIKIMENKNKTLADVTEDYEKDLARMKKEMCALQGLVSEDLEKSSIMDKISKYEDKISNLNDKLRDKALLEKKVGVGLSKQLITLDENLRDKRQENVIFKAVEVMEKDKETTLADVLKDYEEELEKKDHEILTLKELVSGDILEIATSQESEIDQLKKVKAILANELDLISDKVGKELMDEIMKRSNQHPQTESGQFYAEIVERMETERKPLADILEDYEREIKLMRSKNEELSRKGDTLTELSEKIGKDLSKELLKADLGESSQTEDKPLFQALKLMSVEEKTLGEVIVNYEDQLAKLKRENGALRLLTDKGGSQDNSALDILSDYEEKIEKLMNENRDFNKRLQKLTERVGVELTEELFKLPDEVRESSAEPVNELKALKTLEENQTTLAHVLMNYEKRLKEDDEADLGPLVSGQAVTEDVKLAQLVHVGESEPQITISDKEPLKTTRYQQEADVDETKALEKSKLSPSDRKDISSDDQDQLKALIDVNTKLRSKLEQLSRKVGKELAEELMRSPEDEDNEIKAAVTFASVRDLNAFDDVVAERATLTQVLESYEKQLKGTLQDEKDGFSGPLVESLIVKEDIKRAQLLRANEYDPAALTMSSDQFPLEETICDVSEAEVVSQYNVPNLDSYLIQDDEAGDSNPDIEMNESLVPDLDLRALGDLILNEPKIMAHPEESPLSRQNREIIKEEMVKLELPMHEESSNYEYMGKLLGTEIPVAEKEEQSEVPDSTWTETYLSETKAESGERETHELESLKNKVMELEKELEEEKNLKQKYEKDVQDLLQDIVELKMKQADEDDEGTPEEARQRIKEEVEFKQDNKRLQEDLRKEKKRRLSIEESKRDLLDEVDSLMRDKDMLLKQQNDSKDNEKLLEDMINLRKKLGELDTKNKHLNKEVQELKEALSEVVVTHDDEKNKLLVDCEKEKSEMTEELVASKTELETQLQELLGMNDDLKGTIKNLQEELKESSEKLSTEGDIQNNNECKDTEKDSNDEDIVSLLRKLKELEQDLNEKRSNLVYEKEKNEKLKEQLDETENSLRQTLTKYQDEIKSIETEKAKLEDELRKEIEILVNKLDLEKASAEQQQKDLENVVRREKERLKEDIETEHEREKKKLQYDFEDKEEELSRQGKKRSAELQDQEEQWKKEREELQAIFRVEKEKLQKAFDEELNRKIVENDERHKQRNEEMTMEMNRKFVKEKKEIKTTIEKRIYEQLLDKNIATESDFQEVLSKILQEHSKEIEGVENDIRKAEERFNEDKNKLVEQSDSQKEALKKMHGEEKKALESTIQNLLKEVVKLKQQRKEIRMIHKKEKETIEEIYERDRIKLKDDWELYKRDLLSKLQEDFDNKLANETTKLETRLEDMKQELQKSEQRIKELEDRLKGRVIDSEQAIQPYEEVKNENIYRDDEAHSRELKSMKKSIEEEYDNRLKVEKRKFEETLEGLRREIGNLQEKRRLIQDKIYNQDPSLVDRNFMEKSIANYKMEMLSKIEEEVTQKIAREKKPLEESIKEQQLEIDDLKRQRWELRNQMRRERSKLEEEFELERERIENQFLKEKEELKNKLDTRMQREMAKRAMEDKVNRALSPESPYSPQDSPRRLRSENVSLRDDNLRLEFDVRQLTSKLETLESSFMSSEKIKVEKMKIIQAKMPKKVTFSDEVETRTMDYTTGDPNETVLQELRQRDSQVRQLLEQKQFYEEVLSELCDEAGLFELDQNVVI